MSKFQIHISGSKSISNRFLIMEALASTKVKVSNLSNSDDSEVMQSILAHQEQVNWDVGHAGTAMRFLTAYAAIQKRDIVLCGSQRMHQRPIGPLVDALRSLGVQIDYLENEGFPPLKINGSEIQGGELDIPGSMSSQFISALAMIAPSVPGGLRINILNDLVSKPYLQMTLSMMEAFHIQYNWSGNEIVIPEQEYLVNDFEIESDWSSASYWFSLVAVGIVPEVILTSFFDNSSQGDSALINMYEQLGVKAIQEGNKLILTKSGAIVDQFKYNFHEQPDIAQTVVVSCFMLGVPAIMTGLETLPIKETDRLKAMQVEIGKLGGKIQIENQNSLLLVQSTGNIPSGPIQIETYKDHRMAMAFAPLTFIHKNMEILDSNVVSKSYPDFWKDLSKIG